MRAQRGGIFLLISWMLVIDARNAILRGFLLLAVFRHPPPADAEIAVATPPVSSFVFDFIRTHFSFFLAFVN